jgi:hypothetical protein
MAVGLRGCSYRHAQAHGAGRAAAKGWWWIPSGIHSVVPDNGLEFVAAALGGRMELRAASSHNRSYSCRPLGGFYDVGQRTELPTCIGLPAGADG